MEYQGIQNMGTSQLSVAQQMQNGQCLLQAIPAMEWQLSSALVQEANQEHMCGTIRQGCSRWLRLHLSLPFHGSHLWLVSWELIRMVPRKLPRGVVGHRINALSQETMAGDSHEDSMSYWGGASTRQVQDFALLRQWLISQMQIN